MNSNDKPLIKYFKPLYLTFGSKLPINACLSCFSHTWAICINMLSRTTMTTLASTAPPLLQSTVLPSSTILPTSSVLPDIMCGLGFIWIVETAACMPDNNILRPRRSAPGCPNGYFMDPKFKICLREKYNAKQIAGQIGQWLPIYKTTKKPTLVVTSPSVSNPLDGYTGNWYSYGSNWATTDGYNF